MRRVLPILVSILLLASACQRVHYTVIVSLDGNRWDYPALYEMPFFDSLATVGVAAAMEPSFPASTFPNHYTMATGCVPDHNGIVNNSFRDPDDGSHYAMNDSSKRFNPKYYLKEPIWITAQKQGLVTGNIYWLGGDVAIQGQFPTYWRNWNEQPHWTFEERVDEAVRLMSLPKKERPRLLMVYFDEPDHTGHVSGPVSAETAEMTHRMDSLMHAFYLRLQRLPYAKKINFILAGDHGMTEISPDRFVSWAEALDDSWIEDIAGSIPTNIHCKEGCIDTVYKALSQIPHLNVSARTWAGSSTSPRPATGAPTASRRRRPTCSWPSAPSDRTSKKRMRPPPTRKGASPPSRTSTCIRCSANCWASSPPRWTGNSDASNKS